MPFSTPVSNLAACLFMLPVRGGRRGQPQRSRPLEGVGVAADDCRSSAGILTCCVLLAQSKLKSLRGLPRSFPVPVKSADRRDGLGAPPHRRRLPQQPGRGEEVPGQGRRAPCNREEGVGGGHSAAPQGLRRCQIPTLEPKLCHCNRVRFETSFC